MSNSNTPQLSTEANVALISASDGVRHTVKRAQTLWARTQTSAAEQQALGNHKVAERLLAEADQCWAKVLNQVEARDWDALTGSKWAGPATSKRSTHKSNI